MTDRSLDTTDLTWLAGLARGLLGEAHASDDLVQDTVVAALERPSPDDASPRAWLAGIARRLAARSYRGDSRRRRRESHAARTESLPDDTELLERAEVAEQVTAAARRLPEPFRRTILLRFLEGRSTESIAQAEGKPTDTVRWRVRRGLELLREDLVRHHDRDWSAWCVLLTPLARLGGDAGIAAAGGVVGGSGTWAAVGFTVMNLKMMTLTAAVVCAGSAWLAWGSTTEPNELPPLVVAPQLDPPPTTIDDVALTPPPSASVDTDVRTAVAVNTSDEEDATADVPVDDALRGTVVDAVDGTAIADATVYVLSSAPGGGGNESPIAAQTTTDAQGRFRLEPDAMPSAAGTSGSGADAPATWTSPTAGDLGVVANGYLRRVVADVAAAPTNAEDAGILVTLERGTLVAGRVFDEFGRPVPGLELLAHTTAARITHVSPSQESLRSTRASLAGRSSSFEESRARTDARGAVTFRGLPDGDVFVRSLDPGWSITSPGRVDTSEGQVVWTAVRQLGVRVSVVDEASRQPVRDVARATFRAEVTYADGGFEDWGQWVGRGRDGRATFVLRSELLPPEERDRVITRAVFYGTVMVDDIETAWRAEPIEDGQGARGVAEVVVSLESPSSRETTEDAESTDDEPLPTATLELDVRYAGDDQPVAGGVFVKWSTQLADDRVRKGNLRVREAASGRYRIDVPAGTVTLRVAPRYASGSLAPWTGTVRCDADETSTVFPVLTRGAKVTIRRPADFPETVWRVRASWRQPGAGEWRGAWEYGTTEADLTLNALKPAEWRFILRPDGVEPDGDTTERTIIVVAGDDVVVDD